MYVLRHLTGHFSGQSVAIADSYGNVPDHLVGIK